MNKFTNGQLTKINKKVISKYGDSVIFNNDLCDKTRVVYTMIDHPTDDQSYIYNFLSSLLNTETNFNDVYHSI
jgi:hypothetical protein